MSRFVRGVDAPTQIYACALRLMSIDVSQRWSRIAMTDDIVAKVQEAIRAAVQEAYERGAEDMRRRILSAATGSVDVAPAERPQPRLKPVGSRIRQRAPRGLLQELVMGVLREHQGLATSDVERLVMAKNAGVALRSVAGELRRRHDVYYQQGTKWFLRQAASRSVEGKTTVETGRVSPSSTQAEEAVNAAALTDDLK